MHRPSGTSLRLWWERSSWVLPMLGVFVGALLVQLIELVDEAASGFARSSISPEAATALLAAIGGGMITFSGFVFSFAVLIVQFGSSAYSPRTVSYFLRRRVTQWILALFLATITYSFVGLIWIGSEGRADFVPLLTISFALVLLVSSLLGFIVLMYATGSQIRVDSVLSGLGRHARRRLARLPAGRDGRPVDLPAGLVPIRYHGPDGQVVGIDPTRLVRLVRSQGITVVVHPRVGDGVTDGTPIAAISVASKKAERAASRAVIVSEERSLVHDPLYALRLLVDIAIRALSPAINDPTTAVRSIDEIEGVLRVAASRRLGTVRYKLGQGVLVTESATWEEVVDLALLEISDSGRSQVQVSRRLVALLDDLTPDVPEDRRRALLRYRGHLEAAVADGMFTGRAREVALVGDRQGLGGSPGGGGAEGQAPSE